MSDRARAFVHLLLAALLAACAAGSEESQPVPAEPASPAPEAAPEAAPAEPGLSPPQGGGQVDEGVLSDSSAGREDEDSASGLDGRMLYLHNCSGCHGETGKGDGETARQLGVQARSFAEGRFSFGNAPEDIFRTLSSGIPGRSVMPGFKGTLTDEERWAIVAHVRTLMPPSEAADASDTILVVAERAAVARGKLPPIAEGAPERPRGLLVGTPEGLTFEYAIDDVRLLGVRQGRFADRTDWNDRGGGYLRPLGQPIYLFNHGQPDATFVRWPQQGQPEPLRARLLATQIEGPRGVLEYVLSDAAGHEVARVEERLSAEGLSSGAAFTRRVRIRPAVGPTRLAMLVAGSGKAAFPRNEPDVGAGWIVSEPLEGVHEAVHLDLPPAARAGSGEAGVFLTLEITGEVVLRVTLALTADVSPALLEKLAGEIGR